jgi:hypothetical protein
MAASGESDSIPSPDKHAPAPDRPAETHEVSTDSDDQALAELAILQSDAALIWAHESLTGPTALGDRHAAPFTASETSAGSVRALPGRCR